jgi:hypothetical protein
MSKMWEVDPETRSKVRACFLLLDAELLFKGGRPLGPQWTMKHTLVYKSLRMLIDCLAA